MRKTNKVLFITLISLIGILGLIGNVRAATSTVILDPPDIPSLIANAYNVAQPLMNSFWAWVGVFIGIGVVFWIITKLLHLFGQ